MCVAIFYLPINCISPKVSRPEMHSEMIRLRPENAKVWDELFSASCNIFEHFSQHHQTTTTETDTGDSHSLSRLTGRLLWTRQHADALPNLRLQQSFWFRCIHHVLCNLHPRNRAIDPPELHLSSRKRIFWPETNEFPRRETT